MPYLAVTDLRLYYEEQGQGAPLVLLHGGGATIDDPAGGWATLAPRLAERYRAIQLELRGHGRTDNRAGHLSYELLVDDAAAVITALGLAPAHVAGISGGGITALLLGLRRPELVRGLVAVGAYYTNDERTRAMSELLDPDLFDHAFPERSAALAAAHDAGRAPGYWRTLIRQVAATVAASPPFTLADLGRLTAPTLLIAGDSDPWFDLRQVTDMKARLRRGELLVVNAAGHDPQHTHPHLVGPAMLAFLDRQTG